MATYYAKPFEGIDKAIYSVNPAAYLGAFKHFGHFPYKSNDPWNEKYVHYNAVVSSSNAHFGDEPMYADSDSVPHPGYTLFKFFSWSTTVNWSGYQSLIDNPQGMFAKQVKDEVETQQDYFAKQIDDFCINYIDVNNGSRDEDPEWLGMLHAKGATGTVKDPQDLGAGTILDLKAINLSGTAQTVGAIDKSIGVTRRKFFQEFDTVTTRSMYKPKGNMFDLWWNPAVTEQLRGTHEANAAGELDYSRPTLDIIKQNLSGGKIIDTYAVDNAYDGATTTIATTVLTMNTKQNFQIGTMIPYTVLPWVKEPGQNNALPIFRKLAYTKIGCLIKPYNIGGTWKKAAYPMQVTPYENT